MPPVPWYYHPSTTPPPPPPAAAHYAHGAHQQYHGVLPFYPAAAAAAYGYVRARRSQLRIPIPRAGQRFASTKKKKKSRHGTARHGVYDLACCASSAANCELSARPARLRGFRISCPGTREQSRAGILCSSRCGRAGTGRPVGARTHAWQAAGCFGLEQRARDGTGGATGAGRHSRAQAGPGPDRTALPRCARTCRPARRQKEEGNSIFFMLGHVLDLTNDSAAHYPN